MHLFVPDKCVVRCRGLFDDGKFFVEHFKLLQDACCAGRHHSSVVRCQFQSVSEFAAVFVDEFCQRA